jgi:hypothetical protein
MRMHDRFGKVGFVSSRRRVHTHAVDNTSSNTRSTNTRHRAHDPHFVIIIVFTLSSSLFIAGVIRYRDQWGLHGRKERGQPLRFLRQGGVYLLPRHIQTAMICNPPQEGTKVLVNYRRKARKK